MAASHAHFFVILFYFFVLYFTTIDSFSIRQDTVEQPVNSPIRNDDQYLVAILVGYRYRFETFKVGTDYSDFCKACGILVPLVS
jgi:hypothetical protein